MDYLNKLKELKKDRADSSLFSDFSEFEDWAYRVLGLLKIDAKFHTEFENLLNASKLLHGRESTRNQVSINISDCIGILNQAINYYENIPKKIETPKELVYPQKITLKWLWEHVPASLWISIVMASITIFSAGYGTAVYFEGKPTEKPGKTESPNTIVSEMTYTVPSFGDGLTISEFGIEYIRSNVIPNEDEYSIALELRTHAGRNFEVAELKGYIYDYTFGNTTYRLSVERVNLDAASVEISIRKM